MGGEYDKEYFYQCDWLIRVCVLLSNLKKKKKEDKLDRILEF